MSDRELLERVIKVEEDISRTMKRIDTSFDRRMEPVRMQMEYHKMLMFKIVIPLVVGIILIMAASSEPGTAVISGAGNVIKSFVGQGM